RFSGAPVEEGDLLAMLEAARLAPSATNEQPWHFTIIRDAELKARMRGLVEALVDVRIECADNEQSRERLSAMRYYSTHFADAPLVIAVSARPWRWLEGSLPGRELSLQSASAAIAHLLLAATALGYGGCWNTAPLDFAAEELEALLGIEQPWFLVALVSLGVAAGEPSRAPRKPLDDICTFGEGRNG
ncbi:nitroreductase family protein, partial [Chloroflexota bacterium]